MYAETARISLSRASMAFARTTIGSSCFARPSACLRSASSALRRTPPLIAAREAAKAPADGHSLFLALINNAVADLLTVEPCCRLNQELVPVSRFSMTPLLLVVHRAVPAQTLQDYLDYAKAKPEALSYASHGPGSVSQLVADMLKMERGVRLLEVPYKGVNSELPDLQSGQV